MGRGRAKAKQTKVARELKYHVANTDFTALQHELTDGDRGSSVRQLERNTTAPGDDTDDDPYADVYASDEDD